MFMNFPECVKFVNFEKLINFQEISNTVLCMVPPSGLLQNFPSINVHGFTY
jgi:hypothetical protein